MNVVESCAEEKTAARINISQPFLVKSSPRVNIRIGLYVKSQIAYKNETISKRPAISKTSFYGAKTAYNKITFIKRVLSRKHAMQRARV